MYEKNKTWIEQSQPTDSKEAATRNDQIHITQSNIYAPVSTSPIVMHYHNFQQPQENEAEKKEEENFLIANLSPLHKRIWNFIKALPWKPAFWICQALLFLFFLKVLYIHSFTR